ncbi:hypothetical protein DXT88_21620 [Herbaspirillum lusitanum]|nr:hypothetical protein [Herbaspirillum lusitanum]
MPTPFPVPGPAVAATVFLTVRDFTTTTLAADEVVAFFGAALPALGCAAGAVFTAAVLRAGVAARLAGFGFSFSDAAVGVLTAAAVAPAFLTALLAATTLELSFFAMAPMIPSPETSGYLVNRRSCLAHAMTRRWGSVSSGTQIQYSVYQNLAHK